MKRYFLYLLIALILFTPIQTFAAPSTWAVQEVEKAKTYDLVTTKVLQNFQDHITREEFAEMAVKLYIGLTGNEVLAPNTNPFSDTNNMEIIKAYNLGIVEGKGSGIFAPIEKITREQIAVMFYRTLEIIDKSLVTVTGSNTFTDRATISSWATTEVNLLTQKGIIKGFTDNTFRPLRNTTKEEAIALTVRMYEQYYPIVSTSNKLTPIEIGLLAESAVMIQVEYNNGERGTGSGFFFQRGVIATNFHVVEGAKTLTIEFENGNIYNGDIKVIGYSKDLDLAILKINDTTVAPLVLGDSNTLVRGQKIYVISSPSGYKNTLTDGIISAVRDDYVQITAPLKPGSSGGALINEYGRVVGVTYSRLVNAEDLGFAIKINDLKTLSQTKNLSLYQFNQEVSVLFTPPKNVTAIKVDGTRVNIQWDENGSDYYKVYESYDGTSWVEVLDPYGRNMWYWYPDFSVEIIGYEEGDLVQFRVAGVKNSRVSGYGYSNTVEFPTGMTTDAIINNLWDFYPYMNVNNIQIPFVYFDALASMDGTVTSIHLYVDELGFEKYIQSDSVSRINIAKELKNLSLYYKDQTLTEVEVMIIFSASYNSNPDFLEANFIEPDIVFFDDVDKVYFVWYPLIDVFSYSNTYFTWYGSYSL